MAIAPTSQQAALVNPGDIIRSARVLGYTAGRSDKEYHGLIIEVPSTGEFRAVCGYGRRGAMLTANERYRGTNLTTACRKLNTQLRSKEAKGYRLEDTTDAMRIEVYEQDVLNPQPAPAAPTTPLAPPHAPHPRPVARPVARTAGRPVVAADAAGRVGRLKDLLAG